MLMSGADIYPIIDDRPELRRRRLCHCNVSQPVETAEKVTHLRTLQIILSSTQIGGAVVRLMVDTGFSLAVLRYGILRADLFNSLGRF